MIAFDLCCAKGHGFEGWFSSYDDYAAQQANGLLRCPMCDNGVVEKALSVPNVGRKGNQRVSRKATTPDVAPVAGGKVMNALAMPPKLAELMQKMVTAQTEMLKDSQWVGREFAETARSIHYGESEDRLIHGEASPDEASALADEGVAVAALPFPVIPPLAKN